MSFILQVKIKSAQIICETHEINRCGTYYTIVSFKGETHKTGLIYHSHNPVWNNDFIFKYLTEKDIYNELLLIRVYDYDANSSNSKIGKINISLMLPRNHSKNAILDGMLPIYSSDHGIQGSLLIKVKLNEIGQSLPSDVYSISKQRVTLYSTNSVPQGYKIVRIHGFVCDHLYSDEESQRKFIDIIRPKSSIDVNQKFMLKLSNRIQAKLIQRTQTFGGNAIIGYRQIYIIQKDIGPYFRACGTVVTIAPVIQELPNEHKNNSNNNDVTRICQLGDPLLGISIEAIQIFTITDIDDFCFKFIGQFVTAYSIQNMSKQDDDNFFDDMEQYWSQIRHEIKLHAYSLGCNAILGYHESMDVVDDNYVLCASGTAVSITISNDKTHKSNSYDCSLLHTPKHVKEITSLCQDCETQALPFIYSTLPPIKDMVDSSSCQVIHSIIHRRLKCYKQEISDSLSQMIPFIERDLMDQFSKKMLSVNCNSVFNIKTNISFNSNYVIFSRCGTAYMLKPMIPTLNKTDISDYSQNYHETNSSILLPDYKVLSNLSSIENIPKINKQSPKSQTKSENLIIETPPQLFTYTVGTQIHDTITLDAFLGTIFTMSSIDTFNSPTFTIKHFLDDDFLHILITRSLIFNKDISQLTQNKNYNIMQLEMIDKEKDILLIETDQYLPTEYINLGYINIFIHKDPSDINGEGGVLKFLTLFLHEAQYTLKSYVKCIGGNGVTSFKIDQFIIDNFQRKNRIEGWINLSGNIIKFITND